MLTLRSADGVIIRIDRVHYRGFGLWWDRLMVALISGIAGFSAGIGLIQYYR